MKAQGVTSSLTPHPPLAAQKLAFFFLSFQYVSFCMSMEHYFKAMLAKFLSNSDFGNIELVLAPYY
ncbi:hypothetical protein LguiA_032067 [Lonicera macranthoides]